MSSFCFLSKIVYPQPPEWQWAISHGGGSGDVANAITIDGSGNIITAGIFCSTVITFGSFTIWNSHSTAFIVKYDPNGVVLWAKTIGMAINNQGHIEAKSVAVDASGNVYVTGFFQCSEIWVDNIKLSSYGAQCNMFLVKYGANGNVLWAKNPGGNVGSRGDRGLSVVIDALGNAYVAGSFNIQIIFDTITLQIGNWKSFDMYLAKYDCDGNVLWAKSTTRPQEEYYEVDVEALSASVDNLGNVYVTGYFESDSITFGSTTLINSIGLEHANIFLVKYDPNGNVLWASSPGGRCTRNASSLDTDASGNVYITGYMLGPTMIFDTITLTCPEYYVGYTRYFLPKIFLAKYNSHGNVIWAKDVGESYGDHGDRAEALSLVVDASGNVYFTGYFETDSIAFNPVTLANTREFSGYADIFLVKCDAGGNVLWAKSAEGYLPDKGLSVGLNSIGDVFVTGYFESSTMTLGNTTLTNANAEEKDIFVAKFRYGGTGINDLNNSSYILIFPNPVTDEINIEISKEMIGSKLTVMNLEGAELFSRQITDTNERFNTVDLPGGIYMVKVFGNDKMQIGKFIKY